MAVTTSAAPAVMEITTVSIWALTAVDGRRTGGGGGVRGRVVCVGGGETAADGISAGTGDTRGRGPGGRPVTPTQGQSETGDPGDPGDRRPAAGAAALPRTLEVTALGGSSLARGDPV